VHRGRTIAERKQHGDRWDSCGRAGIEAEPEAERFKRLHRCPPESDRHVEDHNYWPFRLWTVDGWDGIREGIRRSGAQNSVFQVGL
jgi:hypothetical protein